jgi:hypothetical protein
MGLLSGRKKLHRSLLFHKMVKIYVPQRITVMRAITYSKLGSAKEVLHFQNLNKVLLQSGEVRVALNFSGVNP